MDFSKQVNLNKDEMINTLRNAIKIDSSYKEDNSGYPYGKGVHECLEYVLKVAEKLGFTTTNLDNIIGWCEYGQGPEMIAVLGHLDVVPAGDGWTVDPFGAEIVGDRLYGRGTLDDKGGIIASLYALKAIKDSGVKLNRRIRIIFGCSEETGMKDVEYYLNHGGEIPKYGFTPDGEFPLINGEKSINVEVFKYDFSNDDDYVTSIWGGTAFNIVPNYAYANFSDGNKIEKRGVSVHGSTPEKGENAIAHLVKELCTVLKDGELRKALMFLDEKVGLETDGVSLGINACDDVSGNLTVNMGMIRTNNKVLSVSLDYRCPVTCDSDYYKKILENQFLKEGFEIESYLHEKSVYFDENDVLVQKLIGVYNDYLHTQARPKSIGGGTYAKALPNILAFGPIFDDDENREHMADESIKLNRLIDIENISAMAMYELANA